MKFYLWLFCGLGCVLLAWSGTCLASTQIDTSLKSKVGIEDVSKDGLKPSLLYVILFKDNTPYVERLPNGKYEVPVYYDEMSAAKAAVLLKVRLKGAGSKRDIKVKVFSPTEI